MQRFVIFQPGHSDGKRRVMFNPAVKLCNMSSGDRSVFRSPDDPCRLYGETKNNSDERNPSVIDC